MKCKAAFFGLKELPRIDITGKEIERLAETSMNMGLTVPGVQKKLSVHLSGEDTQRLTLVGYPAGYILKPQTEEYPQLPEAEDLVMDISEMMGVRTVSHGLIDTPEGPAYITKRIDRADGKLYAMEDFCQISGRLTQDKYKGSYERCAEIIKRHSDRWGFDLSEFFLRVVVSFVTGNSDMHLKNFSLIETTPGSRRFVLSKAYDLLPVNLILPEDREEMALTLNGKKARLKRSDFLILAERADLPRNSADKLISSVISKRAEAIALCEASFLHEPMKQEMIRLIDERINRLVI